MGINREMFIQGFMRKLADIQTSPEKAKGLGPSYVSTGMTSGASRISPFMDGPAEGNDPQDEQDEIEAGGGDEEHRQDLGDMQEFQHALMRGEMPPDPEMDTAIEAIGVRDAMPLDTNAVRGGRNTTDYRHHTPAEVARLLSEKIGQEYKDPNVSAIDAFFNERKARKTQNRNLLNGQYNHGHTGEYKTGGVPKDEQLTLPSAPHLTGTENDKESEHSAEGAIQKLYGDLEAYFGRTKKAEFDKEALKGLLGALSGGVKALGRAGRTATRAATKSFRAPAKWAPRRAAQTQTVNTVKPGTGGLFHGPQFTTSASTAARQAYTNQSRGQRMRAVQQQRVAQGKRRMPKRPLMGLQPKQPGMGTELARLMGAEQAIGAGENIIGGFTGQQDQQGTAMGQGLRDLNRFRFYGRALGR